MSGIQSTENENANWDNYSQYFPYIGSVVGAVALGAIGVIVAAPVVVPAIVGVVGVGASTALIAGVIGSAVVGAGIGAGVGYVVGEYIKSGEAKKNDSEFQDEVGGDDNLNVGGEKQEINVQSTGREVGFGPGLFNVDGSAYPRKKMTAAPKTPGAGPDDKKTGADPTTSKPRALDPPGAGKPAGSEETDGVNREGSGAGPGDVIIPGNGSVEPELKPKKDNYNSPIVSEINPELREQKIKEHFRDKISDQKFLNLLDKYREKAIKKILEGGGDFNSKKNRIKQIFTDTFFDYDFNRPSIAENRKNTIKAVILANNDFEAIDDVSKAKVDGRERFFSSSELIKRIILSKYVIEGILDNPCSDEYKIKALKMLIAQHEVNGDKDFPNSLSKQKEETSNLVERSIKSSMNHVAVIKEDSSIVGNAFIDSIKKSPEDLFKDSSQDVKKFLFLFESVGGVYEKERVKDPAGGVYGSRVKTPTTTPVVVAAAAPAPAVTPPAGTSPHR